MKTAGLMDDPFPDRVAQIVYYQYKENKNEFRFS